MSPLEGAKEGTTKEEKPVAKMILSRTVVDALFATLCYCVSSNAMILSNKAIFSRFNFHFPLSLMLFQSTSAAILLEVGRRYGVFKCQPFEWRMAKQVLPLNILFVVMICSSGYATDYISVPLLTVFKNLTNVGITFGEGMIYGTRVSPGVILSIGIMVLGSLCAAFNDVQFSLPGYIWMGINCFVTACYALYMKVVMDRTGLSKDGMALYNNINAMPMIGVLVLLKERDVIEYNQFGNIWFIALCVISGCVAFAISLSTFFMISKTSPTTYSMVGAMNKIPSSILGAIFFNSIISPGGWAGIAIGLLGGIVFTAAKAYDERSGRVKVIPVGEEEEAGEDLELAEMVSGVLGRNGQGEEEDDMNTQQGSGHDRRSSGAERQSLIGPQRNSPSL